MGGYVFAGAVGALVGAAELAYRYQAVAGLGDAICRPKGPAGQV